MKLKPLNDHLILKAIGDEKITKSGIVLPDADKERPERGEVVAVGDGKMLDSGERAKMSVKVGDTVIFKKYSPDEFKIDGEEYLVIKEGDVMAVIN